MTWKHEMKINDLDLNARLEITCRKCRKVQFMTPSEVIGKYPELKYRYVDEVESALFCHHWQCRGHVSIMMNWKHKIEPFIGGLA